MVLISAEEHENVSERLRQDKCPHAMADWATGLLGLLGLGANVGVDGEPRSLKVGHYLHADAIEYAADAVEANIGSANAARNVRGAMVMD